MRKNRNTIGVMELSEEEITSHVDIVKIKNIAISLLRERENILYYLDKQITMKDMAIDKVMAMVEILADMQNRERYGE